MSPAPVPLRRQRGAALLIMLSLAVLAAGAFMMAAFGPGHDDRRQRQQTLARLADAREALIGYALRHGRLPRPAVSPLDGHEAPTPCQSERDCTGVLPWVTLGVDGADSWGKLLRYSVTPAYTIANITAGTTVASKQIMGRDAAGNPYLKVGSARCTAATACAPAVVMSSGRNNLGISTLGVAMANAAMANADELNNNAVANPFFDHAVQRDPARPGGEFDDLLVWVPLSALYPQMDKTGTLRTRNLYSGMPQN